MSAQTKAVTGPTFHPAKGSRLTVNDVQQDPPAVALRNLEEFPDAGDLVEYLVHNGSRYVQALEELADRAGELGDVWEQRFKVLALLVRLALSAERLAVHSDEPQAAEDPHTVDELLRIHRERNER
jgi:hypothetical protein